MAKSFKHGLPPRTCEEPFAPWFMGEPDPEMNVKGRPSMFYREKPSEPECNGWWAGDKLVHEYATPEEVAEILKVARRRLEDRIRKDPEALGRALNAVFMMHY